MTRIEIVTQLIAAQIQREGITFVTTAQLECAGELADILIEYNKKYWEDNKPESCGRMP